MTVAELIKHLSEYRDDLQVCYSKFSEQCLLETDDIQVIEACSVRPDGWIQDARPDVGPLVQYLRIN